MGSEFWTLLYLMETCFRCSLQHNIYPPITCCGIHEAAQQMDSALIEVCTVNSPYRLHQQALPHAWNKPAYAKQFCWVSSPDFLNAQKSTWLE